MSKFYLLGKYSKEGLASIVNNPDSDRSAVAKAMISSVGGNFLQYDFLRGHYDFVAIFDNVDFDKAAAIKAATVSTGMFDAVDLFETVDLNKIAANAKNVQGSFTKPGK
jgi:uncharacterized protein with GYD domain